MIRYFFNFGALEIYNKYEFIKKFKQEVDGRNRTYQYPFSIIATSSSNKKVYEKGQITYDLSQNRKFHYDQDLLDFSYQSIRKVANEEVIFSDTYYGVHIENKLLIYVKPEVLISGTNYQAICASKHKVHKLDLDTAKEVVTFVNKIKATKLAKKMYPNLEEWNGFLYTWDD